MAATRFRWQLREMCVVINRFYSIYNDDDNCETILSQLDLTGVQVEGLCKKSYGGIRFLKPVLYLWKRRCPHGESV